MRSTTSFRCPWIIAAALLAFLCIPLAAMAQSRAFDELADLRRLADANSTNAQSFVLEGAILWANPSQHRIVLQDASGAEELEFASGVESAAFGQRVRLRIRGVVQQHGASLHLDRGELTLLGNAVPPEPARRSVGQFLQRQQDRQWAVVEGEVTLVRDQPNDLQFEMSSGSKHMWVSVGDASGLSSQSLLHRRVRLKGVCEGAVGADGRRVAASLLVPSAAQIEDAGALASKVNRMGRVPDGKDVVLETAVEIRELSPDVADRGLRAKLQGVVICALPELHAFVLQDESSSIYVQGLSSEKLPPQTGEQLEVQGITGAGRFAPVVKAERVSRLGAGVLPEPVQPSQDELDKGSLDAQLVEVRGVVEHVSQGKRGWLRVELRMQYGTYRIDVMPAVRSLRADDLQEFVGALVQLRGCLFAAWSIGSRQVKVGQFRLYDADLTLEQAINDDLFVLPVRRADELMQFDAQAGAFQTVKVAGQLLGSYGGVQFMVDGTNGIRFIANHASGVQPGDLVEVVGYPRVSGAAPVILNAKARKIGEAPLPAPLRLEANDLLSQTHDSTRVVIKATLASTTEAHSGMVMEMQAGSWRFLARLAGANEFVRSLPVGSVLDLTGVFVAQGGNQMLGEDVAPVDLLLRSPADVRILRTPPWWTLRRLLVVTGMLACVLVAAALWITQLRRNVEERSVQLEAQIRERQQAEHQRLMEQERARIAHDLHDELGADITEIGMLATRARTVGGSEDERRKCLEQATDKTVQMVATLEEIVWAMNPKHDSLQAVMDYFSFFADRFLGLANIKLVIETSPGATGLGVDARVRHQLFLVFKEALANVVRHSGASEVRLAIRVDHGALCVSVADNGRGMPAPDSIAAGQDGVANMRDRVAKLKGQFEIAGQPTVGTTVRFRVSLESNP